MADEIIEGKEVDYTEIEAALVSGMKSKKFDGSDGVEVAMNKNYEDWCLGINKVYGRNGREMTALSFIRAVENINKDNGKNKDQRTDFGRRNVRKASGGDRSANKAS